MKCINLNSTLHDSIVTVSYLPDSPSSDRQTASVSL